MFFVHAIIRSSAFVMRIERGLIVLLIASIAVFVLTNVLLRMIGITIAWADEIAVYSMILSGFIGASLMLRGRLDPAVLLLHEVMPPGGIRALRIMTSGVCLTFGLTLIYLCWRWFDPLALIAAGFDVAAFQGSTFNFVYTDTTPVMGAPAYLFYLVMPWFAMTLSTHATANLIEDLGLVEPARDVTGVRAPEV